MQYPLFKWRLFIQQSLFFQKIYKRRILTEDMKRGQAAMEFLMTYGWAILVVLIALSALFFLGVFNPQTSNGCVVAAPFICNDFKATSEEVSFLL